MRTPYMRLIKPGPLAAASGPGLPWAWSQMQDFFGTIFLSASDTWQQHSKLKPKPTSVRIPTKGRVQAWFQA